MLSSWSPGVSIHSSSRCKLLQQILLVRSTPPRLAEASARRSEGFFNGGATRELELQKLQSDQVQVSSKDSEQRDARVALLNKSAAAAVAAQEAKTLKQKETAWRREWLLDEAREIMRVDDRGPPRWYCPVEAAGFPENAPLLLWLPEIISNGFSIKLHQQKLARLFEVRCLHVPFYDQTPYENLLEQVEAVIQEEQSIQPNRTIYLMGEAYGALLALLLAAHNPNLDLVLVLVDPGTWCDGYQVLLSPFQSLLDAVTPGPISLSLPFLFSLTFGDLATLTKAVNTDSSSPQLQQQQRAIFLQDLLENLSRDSIRWSKAQCQWKVKQLQLAAYNANRQLGEIKADVLLLASGKEQNVKAAKKLKQLLPFCTVRFFRNSNPALLLDERVQVASLIKATNMYRASKYRDIALDYLPPTEDEVKTFHESHIRILKQLFSPVFFTVGKDGKTNRGLPQVTKEHPILFICNHTLVGFDLGIIVNAFLEDQNVMIRSLAHPTLTTTTDSMARGLQESGIQDVARLFGAVPVTGSNLYKLMAAHEAVLLLPGGVREALKSKEDAYKLLWPKKAEFVRTAIRHGATIIPIAAVGGDDFFQILLDQDQMLQFPVIGEVIRNIVTNRPRTRVGNRTELADQLFLSPLGFPKLPPRMYFAFQQPIYTYEFPQLLHDKEAVDKLYKHVQSEIELGLDYLLQKRKEDTYESFIPRAIFESTWGHSAPTFKP